MIYIYWFIAGVLSVFQGLDILTAGLSIKKPSERPEFSLNGVIVQGRW